VLPVRFTSIVLLGGGTIKSVVSETAELCAVGGAQSSWHCQGSVNLSGASRDRGGGRAGLRVSRSTRHRVRLGERRLCMNPTAAETAPTQRLSRPDRKRDRSTKLGHPVQDVARDRRFGFLGLRISSTKPVANDGLVPEGEIGIRDSWAAGSSSVHFATCGLNLTMPA
jgi:hypothetical protein